MSKGKLIGAILGAVTLLALLNLAAYVIPEEGTKSHVVFWTAKIFNFSVFVSVLAWALLKKADLPARMEENRLRIRRSLEEAERKRGEAEKKLAEVEARLRDMDAETARIVEEARVQAGKDAEKLKRDARREAARMLEKMEREIALRSEAARRGLLAYASGKIAEEAMREARARMNDELQGRMVDRAVDSLKETVQ